jgi:hypothetical protein
VALTCPERAVGGMLSIFHFFATKKIIPLNTLAFWGRFQESQ